MKNVCLLFLVAGVLATVAKKPVRNRIYNGSTAANAQFPYQAFVHITKELGDDLTCSGAIIGSEWIVTTAFCIVGAKLAKIQVGSNTIVTSDPHRKTVIADKFYIPDGYDDYETEKYKINIGLIRLPSPIVFNEYIAPIKISNEDVTDDVIVTASGWGSIQEFSNETTNYLQYAPMRIITLTECARAYSKDIINEGLICTKSSTLRIKNICTGDEGAPLVRDTSTHPVLVGLGTLWRSASCGSDYPSGFTRVYLHRNWINEVTAIE